MFRATSKLEEERLEAAKPSTEVYLAGSSSQGGRFKRKHESSKGKEREKQPKPPKDSKHHRGPKKPSKKRDLKKVKCFNCNKYGHFARSCTEQKVTCFGNTSELCVSSCVFLTESNPLWIVDSGATYHIAKDRGAFVEYRRIPHGTKWIYVGNNTRVEVKGIGTCKLVLEGGRTLLLHDVCSLQIFVGISYPS